MKQPRIPTFVLVGQPNEGKTTLASTLTGDDKAPISDRPGTTVVRKAYHLNVGDEPLLVIYDTPGFQNPGGLVEWFRKNAREENPAAAFLRVRDHKNAFEHELEILAPIAEGAVALHVVNAARPPRQVDVVEAEILRLCGIPRIGVFNPKSSEKDYSADWKHTMRTEIVTWHPFNPCTADADSCIQFIEGLKGLGQEWDAAITRAVEGMRERRATHLKDCAKFAVQTLKDIVKGQKTVAFNDDKVDWARERAETELKEWIPQEEKKFRNKIRRIFSHNEERWQVPKELSLDISSEESWELFGFSRTTIVALSTMVGAGAGALIGGKLELLTLGALGGLPTLIGGAMGGGAAGAAAWIMAGRVADFTVLGNKLGGQSVAARLNPTSRLISSFLGRLVEYADVAASRPHGNRELDAQGTSSAPFTQALSLTDARQLQELINGWSAGKSDASIEKAEEWLRSLIFDHLGRRRPV